MRNRYRMKSAMLATIFLTMIVGYAPIAAGTSTCAGSARACSGFAIWCAVPAMSGGPCTTSNGDVSALVAYGIFLRGLPLLS